MIAADHGLNFVEYTLTASNISVEAKFHLTRTKDCDCDSVLGKKHKANPEVLNWDKERSKLERKRFSENRIALLITQKQKVYEDRIAQETISDAEETKTWLSFLNDSRLKTSLPEIGIMYHQFSGMITNEKVNVLSEVSLPVSKLDSDFLKELKEDEAVWIKL
ncbi:hypothetical protein [Rufibacter sp. LB8]|uniref:hypothetical protein n=1 Tax=Rufibacter sp. LB8 TaxID=2777781 RepID=UPI00178C51A3|nr:hypothetical protein [Rufibacter sp. LB8]